MTCPKRLMVEYESILAGNLDFISQFKQAEDTIFKWTGLLLPSSPPYNKNGFRIEITFPEVYPFKPPDIKITTPIYHPNIDEDGIPCLPLVQPENWKPSLRMQEVLSSLVALINCPELEHPLRPDLADLLAKNPKKFNKKAEEWCKKYGQPRSG